MSRARYFFRPSKFVLSLLVLFLAGCGSSPPVEYFRLDARAAAYEQDSAGATMLGVGPLQLPDYLNRSQIVRRGSGSRVLVDDFERWAEPLKSAVHRVVAMNIDRQLLGVVAVPFPFSGQIKARVQFRLIADIHRFDAGPEGEVQLVMQWAITRVGHGLVVPSRRTTYAARARDAADTGAVVEAMNDVLDQFSRDAAAQLQTVLSD